MQKSMIEVVYLMLVQKLLELESPNDRGQQISQLFTCPHDPVILTHSYDLDSESSYIPSRLKVRTSLSLL